MKPYASIHINICFCLLAAYFFFTIELSMTTHSVACHVMTFILHYFILATFAWMSANSYKMLRTFAQVNLRVLLILLQYCDWFAQVHFPVTVMRS